MKKRILGVALSAIMTATSLSGVYAEEPVQETAEEVVQEEVSQEIVPQEEAVSEETVEESSEELTEEVTQSEAVQEEVTEEQTTVAQEEQAVEEVSAKESPAVENIDEAVTVQVDGIVESGKCGDNVTYTIDSDGVLTISGSGDMYNYKEYSNESPFSNKKFEKVIVEDGVTSIGDDAFEYSSIGDISISDTVKKIGSAAFYGSKRLREIKIPDSVTDIGALAFNLCGDIVTVTLSKNMTQIKNYTFESCKQLVSIDIPEGILSIDKYAFSNCSRLKSVKIPNSVTNIGPHSFWDCGSLKQIEIPSSVTNIDTTAFDGCTAFEVYCEKGSVADTYKYPEGTKKIYGNMPIDDVLYSGTCGTDATYTLYKDGLFVVSGSGEAVGEIYISNKDWVKKVEVKEGITKLAGCFKGFSEMTEVSLPDSVGSISSGCFSECTSLKSITIPSSVKEIGETTFEGCTNLESIIVDPQNRNLKSIEGDVYSKDGTKMIYCAYGKTYVEIPQGVNTIEKSAFSFNENIRSVKIPNSVTEIEEGAFRACTALESIEIPENVEYIRSFCFFGCSNLTDLKLNKRLRVIGYLAFDGCSKLKGIVFPEGLEYIDSRAFTGCSSLKYVVIPKITYMNDWVFSGNNELRIYCIKGSNAEKYNYHGNAKVLPFNEFAHNWELSLIHI